MLRGSLYSLRLKVPKALQARVGRTHVCWALGTGRLNEAVQRARVVAGEIEVSWSATTAPVAPVPSLAPPVRPMAVSKTRSRRLGWRRFQPLTLQIALEGYLADPGRRRTPRRPAAIATSWPWPDPC